MPPPSRARLRRTLKGAAVSTVDVATGWISASTTDPRMRPRHRIVVNSLPKAGTNLLLKALAGMPGTHPMRAGLFGATAPRARRDRPTVPVGVDWPVPADAAATRRVIARTPPGGLLLAHVPYSRLLAATCAELDVRMTLIMRDPRDVAVSLAAYIADRPHHFLHRRFAAMAPDERIMAALTGLPPDESGRGLRDLAERSRDAQAWGAESFCILVRFEDLVGPQGGGDRDTQIHAMSSIASHVGVEIGTPAVAALADSLFGGTDTFRRGRAGGWRESFTEQHREVAEHLLGDVLRDLGYEPTTGP